MDVSGAEAVGEPHAFFGDAIKIGCLVDTTTVTAHCVSGMIVRHNE
jgi:hypothetical protein